MPRLRDLLQAADEAPGTETDLACAMHPAVVRRTRVLLAVAERRGLVRWHYRRWWITEAGAELLAQQSDLAFSASTLACNEQGHHDSG
jgi:hypothetical protein